MKYLLLAIMLSGCAQTPSRPTGVIKPSDTVYVRDSQGRTLYRIEGQGGVFDRQGVRRARIKKQ